MQNRVTAKHYPDGSVVSNTYENTNSRLKTFTDALGQKKQYTYTADDQIAGIEFGNTVNVTPGVRFTYDPYFRRVASMTDGTGITQYQYHPVGSVGRAGSSTTILEPADGYRGIRWAKGAGQPVWLCRRKPGETGSSSRQAATAKSYSSRMARVETNPLNMGTYNFGEPRSDFWGHIGLDVLHYLLLGNTPEDMFTWKDRFQVIGSVAWEKLYWATHPSIDVGTGALIWP